MSPQAPTAEDSRSFEAEFDRLNVVAEVEVSAEQSRIRNAFSDAVKEAEGRREYVDALSPEMITARGRLPDARSKGFAAGIFAGVMPQVRQGEKTADEVLYGFVIGAVGQLALGIGKVMAAPPEERCSAFKTLARDACAAAAASGGAIWLSRKLRLWLVTNMSGILAVLSNRETAEKMAFRFTQDAIKVSATCGTLLASAFLATTSLWHGAMSAWASYNRDTETASLEWDKAKDVLSLDNLVRSFVSTVSGVVITTSVLPAAGTGFMGVLVPCLAYFTSQWMLEHVITRKKHHGGWGLWLSSWFVEYRGSHVWAGGDFDLYEDHITHQLKCSISLEVVVDPIRSIRTGAIYERAKLYAWLEERGTDPLTRQLTTRLDYIDAPAAKQHAAQLARHLGASAVKSP